MSMWVHETSPEALNQIQDDRQRLVCIARITMAVLDHRAPKGKVTKVP